MSLGERPRVAAAASDYTGAFTW